MPKKTVHSLYHKQEHDSNKNKMKMPQQSKYNHDNLPKKNPQKKYAIVAT